MKLNVFDRTSLMTTWVEIMANSQVRSRSIWMLFLNSHGNAAFQIAIVSDLPQFPTNAFANEILSCTRGIVAGISLGSVALLAARPEAQRVSRLDQDWAECLTAGLSRWGINYWPVAISAGGEIVVADYPRRNA